jgi:hypothetical protein
MDGIAAEPMELIGGLMLAGMLWGSWVLLRWLFGVTPHNAEVLRNAPELNTRNWEVHAERLNRFGHSKYRGLHYFRGPRGGLYYINRNGHKTYC